MTAAGANGVPRRLARDIALGIVTMAVGIAAVFYLGRWLGLDMASPWITVGLLFATSLTQTRRADLLSQRLDIQTGRINALQLEIGDMQASGWRAPRIELHANRPIVAGDIETILGRDSKWGAS